MKFEIKTDIDETQIKEIWVLDKAIIKIYYKSGVCDVYDFKKRVDEKSIA